MSLSLYINGQLVDLEPGQVIAQTKQVNDLNSLENRQASYTNKFKIPKTATNVRIMEYLTLSGNSSNIPYQKNECSLYNSTGECFIYKGQAVVNDDGDYYETVIYDGIIGLYKEIENKTLGDLDLWQLKHDKNVDSVVYSWTGGFPYIYVVADYNGDTTNFTLHNGIKYLNIDYLVPCVRLEYFVHQILAEYNFSIGGSIFTTPEFKNLFITYPKGMNSIEDETLIFESTDYKFFTNNLYIGQSGNPPVLNKYYARFNTAATNTGGLVVNNNMHFKVPADGTYKIEVSGRLQTYFRIYGEYEVEYTGAHIYLAKNSGGYNPAQAVPFETLAGNIPSSQTFEKTKYITLNAGDTVSVVIGPVMPYDESKKTFLISQLPQTFSVRLTKIDVGKIDFDDALSDFSMRDFLKELVQRFGLTIHKDKYRDHYHFYTLKEQLETDNAVDWSNKFAKKLSESYTFSSYAQRNWFRYQYNDKESHHYDGHLDVANVNLPIDKNVVASKIYSPEKEKTAILDKPSNVYKLWDKELVETTNENNETIATIEYKPLDKRYYIMRIERVTGNIIAGSKTFGNSKNSNGYYKESFAGLPWQDVVDKYYDPLKKVLDKSLIINAEFYLTDNDIANFDFKKLYYIAQLSGYFLVNKINNYIPGKLTKCELLRVKHTPTTLLPVRVINPIVRDMEIGNIIRLEPYRFQIFYSTRFTPRYNLIYQYSVDNITWRTAEYTPENESPKIIRTPVTNARYFRMLYEGDKNISNIFELND